MKAMFDGSQYDGNELVDTTSESTVSQEPTAEKSRILIADDSATIRATLAKAVNDEFESIGASDGEQAWNVLLDDASIELVVTDLAMPGLDGFGLIRRMRASESSRIRNTPVIVVTGANDTAARERAFIEGANDFIAKTSDHVEFLARVRAHQKLAQTIRELENSRRFLREQANTDPLTKLANRRNFFTIVSTILAQMNRQNEHFSVVMLDIDHFKRINDTYGHQAGDFVLVELAKVLSGAIREGDVLARMGGEEFVVASPYTNRLAAIVLSERLRKSVEDKKFLFEGNQIPVTISLGVASKTKSTDDIDKLLAIADARLYIAKEKGRNRICASDKNRNERLTESVVVCPKVDEALTMIKHGNTFRLLPHLHELTEQLIPLFELINEQDIDQPFDLAEIRKTIEALESLDD